MALPYRQHLRRPGRWAAVFGRRGFMRRGSLQYLRSSLVLAGGHMSRSELYLRGLAALLLLVALPAGAQSFRVQCPTSTITHPAADNNSEPAYTGPTAFTPN